MDAGVARRTLEYLRVMEELLDLRIGLLLQRSELRHLIRRLLKRNTWPIRDELRDPVGLAERQVEHARHIPYDRLRAHRSKRDDLAYVVAAVLLDHVVDDLRAATVVEVDVDIRHRHAFRVEEAFEEEVVAQRVDVGDAEAVGNGAPRGRAAARARPISEIQCDRSERTHDLRVSSGYP